MTIKGYDKAQHIAIDRARRTKETICIVQVERDEYVLWREESITNVSLIYEYYRIIAKVDKNGNVTR